MTEQLIISVSGLRGIVGENLTAATAADYGRAFGTFLKTEYPAHDARLSVCIGRDSRPSGRMLQNAVTDGLCRAGIDVIDLGIVTTPGVGVMVRQLNCTGGVVVTASHNPVQYNGIKLLLDNAMAPPQSGAEQIKGIFLSRNFDVVSSGNIARIRENDRTGFVHIQKVLAIIDKQKIAAEEFKVALDSVNGSAGWVTEKLLARLGCQTLAINVGPTGDFAHEPEPIAENLTALCAMVKEYGAQIGFAQDPDGDRLAIVDENGTCIGEEYTLALAAQYVFSKKSGTAATNLSTSMMIDDIAERVGSAVIRTPVGEANVVAAMIEHNCIIGGEGNGGVIDLRVVPVRDSLVAIALVLQLMAETGKTLSSLVGRIGCYHMVKSKFTADKQQARQLIAAAIAAFAGAKLDTSDGCRFDFDDGWLHIRASNTEPVVRLIVEAKDEAVAQKYIDAVSNIRRQILS